LRETGPGKRRDPSPACFRARPGGTAIEATHDELPGAEVQDEALQLAAHDKILTRITTAITPAARTATAAVRESARSS
jgi:hypothetical protein